MEEVFRLNDVLATILKYRKERGWSEYDLALHSGLKQSTISSWYRRDILPTLPSLLKICNAFQITLSMFFSDGGEPVTLTKSQMELLECWSKLSPERQKAILYLIDTISIPERNTDASHEVSG